MRDFKINKGDKVIIDTLDTSTACYITLRRAFSCWLRDNLLSLFKLKFTYTPYYIVKNLTGYRITDMEVIDLNEEVTIVRFDKCCEKPED